jgi:transitional endoplasmic reticulum ATPase
VDKKSLSFKEFLSARDLLASPNIKFYDIKVPPKLKSETTKETDMALTAPSKNGDETEVVRKVDFESKGDRIIYPEDMDLDQVKQAVERQIEEESVVVSINEPIAAFPLDGAVAMMRVLKRRYGWTHLEPTNMGFFGTRPPTMIGVEIGGGQRVQVPWGNMSVPKIDGTLTTGFQFKDGMPFFLLSGNVKRKHEKTVSAIANEIREEIKTNSIYRGKTTKINFRDKDGDRVDFNVNLCPKFLDIDTMGDTEPIFSKSIEDAIRVNIFNPIRFSKRCQLKGAALKKGVMLGGPFGTGKTLAAFQTAKLCAEHGWTFLYLADVRDLDLAIGFAKLYQPCLLFAEDCDRVAAGQRTADMDRLLNTIDGVESKNKDEKLIVVLTTNHLQCINPAFVRPGRIDAVINVTPPDEEACLRIVKKYVKDGDCQMEGSDADFTSAIKCLVGANAAFFRTTVEQAKLKAIENMESDDSPVVIRPGDLKVVAEAMVPHCKLINPEHGVKRLIDLDAEQHDPMEIAGQIIMQKMAETFIGQITNPKILEKIIVKQMKPRGGFGGTPSSN